MRRQSTNLVYRTVVILWITLTSASVVLSAVAWRDLSKSLSDARQAVVIRNEVDDILKLLLDVETAQRGYTITGDETFLEPMQTAEVELPGRFDELANQAKRDPVWLKGAMDLRAKAEVVLAFHRDAVEERLHTGFVAAAALMASRRGLQAMDDVRDATKHLRDLTGAWASETGVTSRGTLRRASLTSLAAGGVGVCAGLYALWLAQVMLGHQARERRLVEAKLEAERSSREKTVFLANMSHEIRTPMNAIMGFTEILASELQDPMHRRHLRAIRTSAGSLLQLINDILDMSKIEAGVMELRMEPTDPREICDFVQTLFAESAAKKGVQLECLVPEDLPRALLLDRIRLRQILVNLVGNAVKFTDRGHIWVRLACEKSGSGSHVNLLIEVQDTGVGIPQERLDAIFKPFTQAGAHREKEQAGTGLGLSIVQRLTESMGGTVTVASVQGEGSAFSLRFREVAISARLALPDAPAVPGEEVDFNDFQPATVLVADDHPANCELLTGFFTGSHHRVMVCSTGAEAVRLTAEASPDVVLLDIRMPEMDGHEALAAIRMIPGMELRPVIAVTASSLLSEEAMWKERFSGYLRKPFSRQELYRELAQFLPRREPMDPPETGDETREAPAIGDTAVSAELLAFLANLETTEWPVLRESLAVNETRAFARRLIEAGQRGDCAPVVAYGGDLDRHAAAYEVDELERQLAAFPQFVQRLREKGS